MGLVGLGWVGLGLVLFFFGWGKVMSDSEIEI